MVMTVKPLVRIRHRIQTAGPSKLVRHNDYILSWLHPSGLYPEILLSPLLIVDHYPISLLSTDVPCQHSSSYPHPHQHIRRLKINRCINCHVLKINPSIHGLINEISQLSESTNIKLQIRWTQVWICVTDSPFQRHPLITSFNEGSLPGETLCSVLGGGGGVMKFERFKHCFHTKLLIYAYVL